MNGTSPADYYPYTFVNKEGVPAGFSVDLANAVGKIMGMDMVITVDTWDHAIHSLETGVYKKSCHTRRC